MQKSAYFCKAQSIKYTLTVSTNGFGLHQNYMSRNMSACAAIKGSDQPAHTRSLIRAFASRLNIL